MDSPILAYVQYVMVATGTLPVYLINSHKRLYTFYQYLVQASFVTFTVFIYGAIPSFEGSIMEMFQFANGIIVYTIVYIKGLVCMTQNMGKLILEIIIYEAKVMNSTDGRILEEYQRTVRKSKGIQLFYISTIYVLCIIFIVPHYLNYFHLYSVGGAANTSLNIEKSTPYDWWLPFDTEEYYLTTLSLQTYCATLGSNYYCFIQIILVILPVSITLRIRILKINLRRINDVNVGPDGKNLDTVKKLFVECAQEHIDIIRSCNFLNDTIKYLMLLEFLVASGLLSLGLFLLVSAKELNVIMFAAAYVLQTLGQLLVTYWYINDMREESFTVADVVCEINWYNLEKSLKTSIQIMMMRSQKPLSLTIGPFGNITLELAVKIVKGSYTYVALMQQSYRNSDSVF